jgi:signal transduction histidine kinase
LSYAAIALLAALALGAVLLLTLHSYYLRVERDYLRGNAQAIALNLAQLLEQEVPLERLQALLDDYSFLSQTSVVLLDSQGQLVVSSDRTGRPVVAIIPRPEGRLPLPDTEREEPAARSGSLPAPGTEDQTPGPATVTLPVPATALPDQDLRLALVGELRGRLPYLAPPQGDAQGTYSTQVVQLPILDSADHILGFVELSEGPAYAREIVGDAAWGWAIASAVAVALAAVAGWLISRQISSPLLALTDVTASMADGALDARAEVARKDELGTLGRSFNRMADRVEDTVVTLRRFVSDAAHEIHTPLTALRTNLELVQQDTQEGNTELIAGAQDQVERLEELTSGLLDLSRIEAGNQDRTLDRLDLVPLVRQVSEVYASQAEQAGLAFSLSLPGAPVWVRGDGAQLRSALANLLDNALKFTPAGGSVGLGLHREGDMGVLWVEDTGIGIPEQDRAHLFRRFHRGRNAANYPGSGLGLAIVKAIAERHGGRVLAEPLEQGTMEQGTMFHGTMFQGTMFHGTRFTLQVPGAHP